MDSLDFTKTIRFKLTFWYSLLLFAFASLFVLGLNIYVAYHLRRDPALAPQVPQMGYTPNGPVVQKFKDLEEEERERITEIRKSDLGTIRTVSLFSLIPLGLVSFAGGFIISGKMLKPVSDLNKATREINAENLQRQIYHEGPDDELGQLVNNFNEMIKRLNTSFELQKQFVADASHELKTPLAIMQTNLDTILEDKTATKEELIKAVQNALQSVKQMDRLGEDLLLLSTQNLQNLDEDINLNSLLNRLVSDFKPIAAKEKVKLESTLPSEAIRTKGNQFLLTRAFSNLIDNAIKYTRGKEDARVTISLQKTKDGIEVTVQDNGQGIPQKDLPFIFDRFYRVDKSRSRKEGGFGLGLAITKKIIEEHGGKIKGESEVGKGSKFRVLFLHGA